MTTQDTDPGKIAAQLAGAMRPLGPGSMAALRRMEPQVPSTVFWRIAAQAIPEAISDTYPDRITRLAHLTKLLAIAGAIDPGSTGHTLGKALKTADVSEMRLERLLATANEDFGDFLERTARRLRNQGVAIKPSALGWACLAPNDQTRRRIARDFYLTTAKTATDTPDAAA